MPPLLTVLIASVAGSAAGAVGASVRAARTRRRDPWDRALRDLDRHRRRIDGPRRT